MYKSWLAIHFILSAFVCNLNAVTTLEGKASQHRNKKSVGNNLQETSKKLTVEIESIKTILSRQFVRKSL